MTIIVVEVSKAIPAVDSVQNSANSFAIPLTFFDLPWLAFPPSKRVFFYRLTESTREHFHSFILPKLKISLSLVLRSYLPLSGHITWDPNESKPCIVASPKDGVSLTIAESEANFSLLSSYEQRTVNELQTLVPKLPVSEDSASVYSLQITLFPNHGFSIGFAAHHAVLDGKTAMMFIKAWAHMCKQQHIEENKVNSLPENLTPSLDRSLINHVNGLVDNINNKRSLSQIPAEELGDDVVLSTLVLSREDVDRLRERVKCESESLHLSTFVIAYAYVWTCLVKARGGDKDRSVSFMFGGDFRERLDPPLPETYFGNCVFLEGSFNHKAAEFAEEGGFVKAVEILSKLVKGLGSRKIETMVEIEVAFNSMPENSQVGSVSGSTRLGVYEPDFGWGRPIKSDVISIKGDNISMVERRDEPGGVEIGVCMKKTEADIVFTLFNNGLQN